MRGQTHVAPWPLLFSSSSSPALPPGPGHARRKPGRVKPVAAAPFPEARSCLSGPAVLGRRGGGWNTAEGRVLCELISVGCFWETWKSWSPCPLPSEGAQLCVNTVCGVLGEYSPEQTATLQRCGQSGQAGARCTVRSVLHPGRGQSAGCAFMYPFCAEMYFQMFASIFSSKNIIPLLKFQQNY